MSAYDIIAELPKLRPDELRLVKAQLDVLLANGSETTQTEEHVRPAADHFARNRLVDFLLQVAGTAEGLPEDMAANHDHYLYGTPKRQES